VIARFPGLEAKSSCNRSRSCFHEGGDASVKIVPDTSAFDQLHALVVPIHESGGEQAKAEIN
jgi:hypothetical protein